MITSEDQIDDASESDAGPDVEPSEQIELDEVFERLNNCSREVLNTANGHAGSRASRSVLSEHLLLALAGSDRYASCRVLTSLGCDAEILKRNLTFITGQNGSASPDSTEIPRSPRVERIIATAAVDAKKRSQAAITTLNLLMGLVKEREGVAVILLETPGVGLERVGATVAQAFREGWSDATV